MSSEPFISFVIPVYNTGRYIKYCIDSLINQTYKNFEIIIVDDGSNDDSVEIVNRTLENASFSSFLMVHQENKGVSGARNTGLHYAKGKYIIFLDSDDYVERTLVESVYNTTCKKDYEFVFWKYRDVNEMHEIIKKFDYPKKFKIASQELTNLELLEDIFLKVPFLIPIGSFAVLRNFILRENISFDEGLSIGEDQKFAYKAILKSKAIFFINKYLLYYVNRKGSATRKLNIKIFDTYLALRDISELVAADSIPEDDFYSKISEALREKAVIAFLGALRNISEYFKNFSEAKKAILTFYPEIFEKIEKDLTNFRSQFYPMSIQQKLGLKIFKFSPILYFYMCKAGQNIKSLFS